MAKYLDYQGVSTLWSKMKSYVDTKAGGDKLAIDGSTQMQGDIEFSQLGNEGSRGLIFNVAQDDYARIVAGANGYNNGYLEIATADDGTEPIYVRQYSSGKFAQLARTATLLDESGNTVFPGEVTAPTMNATNKINTSSIQFPAVGDKNVIEVGTGDGHSYDTYNLRIGSWWGIGFYDTCFDTTNIVMNTRTGDINTKGNMYMNNDKLVATQEYVDNKISGVSGSSYKLNLLWSGSAKEVSLTFTDNKMYVICFSPGYSIVTVYNAATTPSYGTTIGLICSETYFYYVEYAYGKITCKQKLWNGTDIYTTRLIYKVYEIV